MRSALLFLVFNRPDATARSFDLIRSARPTRLYVAADGPRENVPADRLLCAQVRALTTQVDWPCELHTLFRDNNLGCRMAVSSAIDWFFQSEAEGVILEDDVLPDSSFFRYCDDLLDRYRDDESVAAISGCNLVEPHFPAHDSYFFSRYCHVWGWGTWRRAWNHYDVGMAGWPEWEDSGKLDREFSRPETAEFWRHALQSAYDKTLDTWDVQWLFACWQRGASCALPGVNLTRNIGFAAGATHTSGEMPAYVRNAKLTPMNFPLRHPGSSERSRVADDTIDRLVFAVARQVGVRAEIRGIARRLKRIWAR